MLVTLVSVISPRITFLKPYRKKTAESSRRFDACRQSLRRTFRDVGR